MLTLILHAILWLISQHMTQDIIQSHHNLAIKAIYQVTLEIRRNTQTFIPERQQGAAVSVFCYSWCRLWPGQAWSVFQPPVYDRWGQLNATLQSRPLFGHLQTVLSAVLVFLQHWKGNAMYTGLIRMQVLLICSKQLLWLSPCGSTTILVMYDENWI